MTTHGPPKVSVLMPAHNYEQFIGQALSSALMQDYPAELLDVVVVDDGSTDGTADVVQALAEANPGRIKLVQQQNSGQVATVRRAREEADGELLALLDADDVWLPAKISRQVEALTRRPEIGLVFCDMHTIDGEGRVIKQSQYEPGEPNLQKLYARTLRSNIAYNSSLLFRAEMFRNPPAEIEDWDWWITLCAAERNQVDYLPEALALYRQHGDNMLLGASGSKLIALRKRQLRFALWTFRNMDLSSLSAEDLMNAWGGPEWFVMTAAQATGSNFQSLVSISDEDRAEAEAVRREAEAARSEGDPLREAALLVRALAWDPYDPDAFARFRDAAVRAHGVATGPDPLDGARKFVVLARAEDLLAGDDMLLAYAAAMAGAENATLAVDASRLAPAEAVSQLRDLVARCGLAERDDIDVLAVVQTLDVSQQRRMRAAASARYVRSRGADQAAAAGSSPTFTPEGLAELRLLASASG